MKNKDIRALILEKELNHYEVAEKLGITAFTFSVWLREELNEEKKKKTLKAIKDLSKNKKQAF